MHDTASSSINQAILEKNACVCGFAFFLICSPVRWGGGEGGMNQMNQDLDTN